MVIFAMLVLCIILALQEHVPELCSCCLQLNEMLKQEI